MQFISDALETFVVVIFSSRSNQPGGLNAMQYWMERQLFHAFGVDRALEIMAQLKWPLEKPSAFVTLDDRAITFTGTWPALADLRNFKPWNKP
jgi:hypothetical protein